MFVYGHVLRNPLQHLPVGVSKVVTVPLKDGRERDVELGAVPLRVRLHHVDVL